MSSSAAPACTNCNKTENLKKCAKCQTATYCSRECQKSDWKSHKTICNGGPSAAQVHNSGFNMFNQMLGLEKNDHLHKLSEKDAMIQLIDCFRMRLEDEYTFRGDASGIYAEESSLPGFKEFLGLAETRDGILPKWWSAEKKAEIIKLAQRDSRANIKACVEKSDIKEHYDDPMMPAKLRILGEKIYGKGFT